MAHFIYYTIFPENVNPLFAIFIKNNGFRIRIAMEFSYTINVCRYAFVFWDMERENG